MIDQILSFNRDFVARKAYEPFVTDKFPAKKLAVLTCMDTRLTELLPQALGLRNGDAKIIKNAGGLVLSEGDSAIRSLLVAVYELGVEEVMVVHHSGCGACHMTYDEFRPHMVERGIPAQTLADWEARGVAYWLEGFHDTEASVRRTVEAVRSHPLMPRDVTVRGFIIDSQTGALTEIECPAEAHHCCGGHGHGEGGCCHHGDGEGHEGGCCGHHEHGGEGCGCGGHHENGGEGHEGGCCGRHGHRGCHHSADQAAQRVDTLSLAFDQIGEAVRTLQEGPALSRREAVKAFAPMWEAIETLDYYQRSGTWQQDYEAEEAGRLPAGIHRSILSQDGLYNLLRDIDMLLDA